MSLLDQKLEDHLADHEAAQRSRTRKLQTIVTIGMLLSPFISALTTHYLH